MEGRTVDIETPTPGDELCHDTPNNRPKGPSNGPNNLEITHIKTPRPAKFISPKVRLILVVMMNVPHAKQIGNAYIYQRQETATANSLNHPATYQHFDINTDRANQRANQEDYVCRK